MKQSLLSVQLQAHPTDTSINYAMHACHTCVASLTRPCSPGRPPAAPPAVRAVTRQPSPCSCRSHCGQPSPWLLAVIETWLAGCAAQPSCAAGQLHMHMQSTRGVIHRFLGMFYLLQISVRWTQVLFQLYMEPFVQLTRQPRITP